MSDENKGGDAAPENVVDDNNQENQSPKADGNTGEQSVKYETYDKVMRKLKSTEQRLAEMEEEKSKFEQAKLEAEGNKDQLIDTLRKDITERKLREKQIVGSIALSQGRNALVDEAVKAGCNSVDAISKILEGDLQGLEYDSDFKPDREQIRLLIEESRKKYPTLFSKDAPKTANHNINPNSNKKPPMKPIKDMTDEELDQVWGKFGSLPASR